jgi:Sulfotransferase domain
VKIVKIRRRNFSSMARRYDQARGVVVSIPKSGRTWLRVFLHAYCCMIEKREFTLDRDEAVAGHMPQFIFTHDLWQHLKTARLKDSLRGKHLVPPRAIETKPILLLARDPRDVVVSLYFQLSRRTGQYHGTVSEIVADRRFGVQSMVEIMNAWMVEWGDRSNFMLLRYEDCRRSTRRAFAAMLGFFGFKDVNEEVLDRSIQFSSFENMKGMEANRKFKTGILLPRDPADPDSFKVRRGVVGGYKQYLTEQDLAYMEQVLSSLDPRFGYYPTRASERTSERGADGFPQGPP